MSEEIRIVDPYEIKNGMKSITKHCVEYCSFIENELRKLQNIDNYIEETKNIVVFRRTNLFYEKEMLISDENSYDENELVEINRKIDKCDEYLIQLNGCTQELNNVMCIEKKICHNAQKDAEGARLVEDKMGIIIEKIINSK